MLISLSHPLIYLRLEMATDNAIELFNCSLCSFCETSLDRLACHIRQHIKPEPMDSSSASLKDHVTPREHTNSLTELSYRQLNGHVESSVNDEPQMTQRSTEVMSPSIEVINPRTVTTNVPVMQQRPTINNLAVVCKGMYIPPPPPLLEKSPQISPYVRVYSEQPPLGYGVANYHPPSRHDSVMHAGRYVQIHPREHVEIKSSRPYQYPVVNNKPLVHADVVVQNDVKIMLNDKEPKNISVQKCTLPYANQRSSNNDSRLRPVEQIEVMNNGLFYHQRTPIPHGETKYRNIAISSHVQPAYQLPQKPFSTSTMSGNRTSSLQSQVQSRLIGMQYPDSSKNQTGDISFGVPNRGTVILNPDQLLSATGNASLDQLAGLLIVPLKKTNEMATQTDPVDIKSREGNVTSCSVQTDLRMRQVSEIHSKMNTPIFGNFRSTDALFECLVCGEELASDHHLQQHIVEFHTHTCEKCCYSSTNINDYNSHVVECGNTSAEMLCIECNSSFTSLKKLNQHRSKVHNIRMPFRCGICNVPFECHEAVMKHIATHDGDVPEYKCRYCVKLFQSPDALSKHFIRHKGVEVLHECRFCKTSFSTVSLLHDHISFVHVVDESDGVEDKLSYSEAVVSRPTRFPNNEYTTTKKHPCCRHCDLAFKNRDLLRRHIQSCSKSDDAKISAFICDVCKEYFSSDLDRKQHLKQEHRRPNGYRCRKCSKVYRTWSRLKFHTKQQHVKKSCPDCAMIFTKEHILRKHQEDVHGKPQGQPGERVYTCSLCNTMLNTLTELMNHRRDVHPGLSLMKTADQSSSATMLSVIYNNNDSNDSPCDELFTSSKSLVEHKQGKAHMFQCEKCDLVFGNEKRRKNHLGLIHHEKPFHCSMCDLKFQYSSQVVWHMRTHRNSNTSTKLWKSAGKFAAIRKKPSGLSTSYFICQFCGARFRQEKLLKNHKGSVHKIKLFPCELCKEKFGHSTELIWHLRTCQAKFKRQNPGIELPADAKEDYICHICEETFKLSENYQEHMSSHGDEETNGADELTSQNDTKTECELCGHIFPSHASYKTHQTQEHGIDNITDFDGNCPEPTLHELISAPSMKRSNSLLGTTIELLKREPELDPVIGEYSCPICQKNDTVCDRDEDALRACTRSME